MPMDNQLNHKACIVWLLISFFVYVGGGLLGGTQSGLAPGLALRDHCWCAQGTIGLPRITWVIYVQGNPLLSVLLLWVFFLIFKWYSYYYIVIYQVVHNIVVSGIRYSKTIVTFLLPLSSVSHSPSQPTPLAGTKLWIIKSNGIIHMGHFINLINSSSKDLLFNLRIVRVHHQTWYSGPEMAQILLLLK